ncbi:dethiobiotin synthase [Pragia fontium]|uniref:ATP-dependent dethiobiotin synthetase BioD n=2 Tax=Pragia fontium TaxID=82985 RepID=A0AAJ5BHG2_9GAMM|nr:dethiobiotin synthase [Pragia fontium]AKJ43826.1 dethiobiotin synthetase [Pragia fontium]SFC94936.1 dethiobiotin synthetase [Pragia fontium DSM 5563 = ATCC 49100]SUB82555.1 ATP-dependent dethiobiotin synthetase BioD 1 [Pragia fontium]VEJ55454.1 ATP-dependent dethiobiotin synthetase BioD 1 [Pragia fontium]
MPNRFFVTGTCTEVGKTVVSRALLQSFIKQGKRAVGYKPIAIASHSTEEGARNHDALILQSSSSVAVPYEDINPIIIENHAALTYHDEPMNYARLSAGLNKLGSLADCVIVEGTGGWRFLLNGMRPVSDWVIEEKLPVILVVGIQLGCINHAILTAEAITRDGLKIAGWVANRINPGLAYYAETIAALQQNIPAPLIGELPYLGRPEERDLTGFIDLTQMASVLSPSY